jgi:NifU-like protein
MSSAFIKEHFFDPKNVGETRDAHAVGKAGSLSCGATVRISLRLDELQRITDAKFKAAGCSQLVAACSLLTEQIKGQTTADAAQLGQSPEKIIDPPPDHSLPERAHCAALACEALITAIRSYSDAVREEWSGEEALICTCFGVSERTIEAEIKIGELQTIADVTRACNAGAGCRSCYPLIEDILDDHWRMVAVNGKW